MGFKKRAKPLIKSYSDPEKSSEEIAKELLAKLAKRKEINQKKKIDDASLLTGSRMHFYCTHCDALTDTLPENWDPSHREPCELCEECKELVTYGLIITNYPDQKSKTMTEFTVKYEQHLTMVNHENKRDKEIIMKFDKRPKKKDFPAIENQLEEIFLQGHKGNTTHLMAISCKIKKILPYNPPNLPKSK